METLAATELQTRTVAVDAATAGLRLDRVLASALPDLSRMRIKALIQAGLVSRGEAMISEPSYRSNRGNPIPFPSRRPPIRPLEASAYRFASCMRTTN